MQFNVKTVEDLYAGQKFVDKKRKILKWLFGMILGIIRNEKGDIWRRSERMPVKIGIADGEGGDHGLYLQYYHDQCIRALDDDRDPSVFKYDLFQILSTNATRRVDEFRFINRDMLERIWNGVPVMLAELVRQAPELEPHLNFFLEQSKGK